MGVLCFSWVGSIWRVFATTVGPEFHFSDMKFESEGILGGRSVPMAERVYGVVARYIIWLHFLVPSRLGHKPSRAMCV